jgi:transposase
MDDLPTSVDELLIRTATWLTGNARRRFQADVARTLCGGSARRAERRFGWGRQTVRTGLGEVATGIRCLEHFAARGQPRLEDANPQLAADIRELVEPQTHADPELKTPRQYTNLSAREVRELLRDKKGYLAEQLPSERTMRDILNRMGYRLRRLQKSKPLRKTASTDAIFDNIKAVREQAKTDPTTLEISIDTKAKVNEGEYSRGGKNPDGSGRHDGQGVRP